MGLLSILGVSPSMSIDIQSFNPVFIATWNNLDAVRVAGETLEKSTDLLNAVVSGINLPENNPNDNSVGYGGRPDRDGDVTLDACIMDMHGNAGAVTYLKGIKNPISVALKVLQKTPHVILSGQGAQDFAVENGFAIEDLLTEDSKKAYLEWKKESQYKPIINIENHDTIGLLGFDGKNLSGGCSTSGLAYKMAGRVGDSPIIGAGLFVDNEVGACVATGLGEKVLTSCASFLVVELMRQGFSPENACKRALKRILKKQIEKCDFQVGLIALNTKGEHGGFSIYDNFGYAINTRDELKYLTTDYFYKNED